MARASSVRALRGLYAITPAHADTDRLVRLVAAAVEGGAALVQYRAKDLSRDAMLAQTRELLPICRSRGVPLIVNDCVEVAVATGADGVHLGRDDLPAREARARMPGAIIGVSCYADAGCPATRFIGGSLNARATRIDFGRWKTSAVGPYCSSSPASITAV